MLQKRYNLTECATLGGNLGYISNSSMKKKGTALTMYPLILPLSVKRFCSLMLIQLLSLTLLFTIQEVSAQLPPEFGQELLLPEPKQKDTVPPTFTIDTHISNTYNDHIEFGLSVDPYISSLAGQENPQLQGLINQFGINLRGELPIIDKKLHLKLQYAPQYENYSGADGKLNEFDASSNFLLTELRYRPFTNLPEIAVSQQLQRLSRSLNVYNNNEYQSGIRIGRFLEYNFRLQHFDDDERKREDFLLVGSTNHKVTTRLELGLLKQMIGKAEYAMEHGSYQTNLNKFILGAANIADDQRRTDWRHIGTIKLLQTAADRYVFQQEVNLFLNQSNIDYFNFNSTETALSAYYKFNVGNAIRLRLFHLWVNFEGRNLRDADGRIIENAGIRKDTQYGINASMNWRFTSNLSLNADYQFIHNDTNELNEILSFLDYNHNIVSVTLKGNY